jgi:hypothetical protein
MAPYVRDPSTGYASRLGITASTNIKTGAGLVATMVVNTAPTSGGIHDADSVGNANASNLICAIPTVGVSVLTLKFPVFNGITVLLTGGSPNISVAYS